MFATVAQQEIRLIWRDSTWIALAVLILIAAAAALNGSKQIARQTQEISGLQAAESELFDVVASQANSAATRPDQPVAATSLPGALGYSILAHHAVLPQLPLAPLAIGQSDLHQNQYRVTAHEPYTFMNTTVLANPLGLATGRFDLAFVIVFVLPIFIIALVYDLMSRERERGTLALVCAHGVSLQRFALSKCAARAGVVLAVVMLVNLVAFLVAGVDWGNAAAWSAIGWWMLITALYALFWFALALVVNAWPRASDSNGIVLANLWLLFIVILPALLNVAATTLFPAPSRVELTTELREAATVAEQNAAEAREAFFFDHPELADGNQDPEVYFREVQSSESEITKALQPLVAEFDERARSRAKLIDWLQYLSPAILTQRLLSDIAGSSDGRFESFRVQVRDFHTVYQRFFLVPLQEGRTLGGRELEALPRFGFSAPRDGGVPKLPILALSLLLVALTAIAFPRYAHYPVTTEAT